MKNTLNILVLLLAVVFILSCGSKNSEKEAAAAVSMEESTISLSEQSAQLEARQAALRAERKKNYEALIMKTPYYTNDEGIVIYNKAEVAPSYIGGTKLMEKYLADNLVYPEAAKEDGLEGTVYVDFTIANDGSVTNVTASNSTWEEVDAQFNEEAIRVVSDMPKWAPGTQNGKAVYVAYSVPITFRIN